MAMLPANRRFSVSEYYQMARSGILTEDDRVELIEGEIVEMPPMGSRHAGCVGRTNWLLHTRVGDAAIVRVRTPVHLSDLSEPEPDLALVKPRADFYSTSHPGPEDILLLIEVADTTEGYDRGVKAPLYARSNIREMWLVDLEREHIVVRTTPSDGRYRTVRTFRRGERLSPGALPQIELSVDDILG